MLLHNARARCQMVSFGATENAVSGAKLLKRLVVAWGFEPQTPTVSKNQQVLNFLGKNRTACTASTASTARAAHFYVPTLYHRSNEQHDSPEQRAAAFSFKSSLTNHTLPRYGTDSIRVRTHRPSCCFSSSSQLKTMTIFVRSPSGLVADWSIKSRPSGNAS